MLFKPVVSEVYWSEVAGADRKMSLSEQAASRRYDDGIAARCYDKMQCTVVERTVVKVGGWSCLTGDVFDVRHRR
jgi:hypothetical protein